jgi:hypothetical protein
MHSFCFPFLQDHAVVMARFARECLLTLNELTQALEVSLGPDTADLAMRVGLHSGPGTLLPLKHSVFSFSNVYMLTEYSVLLFALL